MRVGGDVVILGLAAEQEVSHAAAYEISLESGTLQLTADIRREFARDHRAIMRQPNYGAKANEDLSFRIETAFPI